MFTSYTRDWHFPLSPCTHILHEPYFASSASSHDSRYSLPLLFFLCLPTLVCTQGWTVELKSSTLHQGILDGESRISVFFKVNPLLLLLNITLPFQKRGESWSNLHSMLPLSFISWFIFFCLAQFTILHPHQLRLDPLACLSSPPH